MKSKLSLPDSVGCPPPVPPPPPLLFESPVLPPLPSEKKYVFGIYAYSMCYASKENTTVLSCGQITDKRFLITESY